MARDRPSPYGRDRGFSVCNESRRFPRSAGACPPRSFDPRETHPQPRGPRRFLSRSMHGEGQALALRTREGFSLSLHGEGQALALRTEEGFNCSLHGEGQALALRTEEGFSAGCNDSRHSHRSAGACPPQSLTQTENRINDRSNEQF